MSVPISNAVKPQATAAAGPPELPPGTRVGSHGLLVVPKRSSWLWGSADHRGRFVFPKTTAPAASSRATRGICGGEGWRAVRPAAAR